MDTAESSGDARDLRCLSQGPFLARKRAIARCSFAWVGHILRPITVGRVKVMVTGWRLTSAG